MPAIEVELEYLHGICWVGKIVGHGAGREFKAADLDAALATVREVCIAMGADAPVAPRPEPPPFVMPVVSPRYARHALRDPAPVPAAVIEAAPFPQTPRVPITKKMAGAMRAERDAEIAGTAAEAEARQTAFARRKL